MNDSLAKLFIVIGGKTDGLTRSLQKSQNDLKKFGALMTGVGAAVTAALSVITLQWASAGDQIEKLATKTGFGTEALSALSYAANLSGSSISELETGIKRMQSAIIDARDGLSTAVTALKDLGLSYEDLKDLAPEEQFNRITSSLADIADPTLKAALAVDLFGRAGTDMLPMLSSGSAGLDKMKQEARDLGVIFTADAAKAAERFNDSITKLKGAITGLCANIAQALAPALTKIINAISGVIEKVTDWMHAHPALTQAISHLALALGVVCTVMGTFLLLQQAWIRLAPLVGAAFHASLGPIGLITLAISGLVAGITLLIANSDKIAQIFEGPATRATNKLQQAIDNLKQSLVPDLDNALQTVRGNYESFISFLQTGEYKNAGFLTDEQLALVREQNAGLADQLQILQDTAEQADQETQAIEAAQRAVRETDITSRLAEINKLLQQGFTVEPSYHKLSPNEISELTKEQQDLDRELHQIESEDARYAYQNLLDQNALIIATGLESQLTTVWQPYFDGIKNGFKDVTTFLSTDWIGDVNKLVQAGLVSPDVGEGIKNQITQAINDYMKSTQPYTALLGEMRQLSGSYGAPSQGKLSWNVPAGQHGLLVDRPTLALLGEGGPELALPLSKLGSLSGANTTEIHNHFGTFICDEISLRNFGRMLSKVLKENDRRNSFGQVQSGYFAGTSGT
jgi:hypothetical protein